MSIGDNAITAIEALLRWRHPRLGLLSPSDFIPLAEETGLIVPLGRWVLDEACRQLRGWHVAHPGVELGINVNMSLRQLREPTLVPEVSEILATHELAHSDVTLEVTESALSHDTMKTIERLHELKELGVRLAIDDFGTGYSSLSYVRSFPIDVIKIPKPFIEGIGESASDASIAAAIVSLGATLGLDTIAEGVETGEQLERLRTLECTRAQGFYFAAPVPADGIDDLLQVGIATAA